MIMFLWAYVMTAAMFPGGERIMSAQADAFQAHMRAQLDVASKPAAYGDLGARHARSV